MKNLTTDPWARAFWPAVIALAVSTVIFEITSADLALQDQFYDFTRQRWLVDGHAPLGRLLFYDGPKAGVIAMGVLLFALTAGPNRWRERFRVDRRGLLIGLVTLATVPALAGLGKRTSNTFCPSEIRRYGGDVPYVKLCSPYPSDDKPARRGFCFPAGHASGGFACMGLAWIRPSRRWRRIVVVLALSLGGAMGTYQMLKGAHYLSHTVTTLLLAWIVAHLWHRVFTKPAAPCATG